MEEEQRRNVFNLRWINQVRSQAPCSPPVTYIQYNMAIHDINRDIFNVSISLSHYFMVERLIGNVKVSITKKVYEKITNERHHLVTPELLARKWGIVLEKLTEMLKATTQGFISSSLLPPTMRYRTYLISKRIRGISCTFYTDMLFATQKSIIVNICAQIFTDREVFVYVHPMVYN